MTDLFNYSDLQTPHLLLKQDDEILHITLNNPDKYNAISLSTVSVLHKVFDQLSLDLSIRVVILKAAGKAFCSGLDLEGALAEGANLNNGQRIAIQKSLSGLLAKMHRSPQPVISLAKGAACGFGLGLLCASDLRYGCSSLKVNAAFIKIGFTGCDMGVSYFLPKIVGLSAANEMMLTGRFYKAGRLQELGFLTELVDVSALDECGDLAAADMLKTTPFGLRMTKECIKHNLTANSFEAALAMEDRQQILAGYSEDQQRSMMAFMTGDQAQFLDD